MQKVKDILKKSWVLILLFIALDFVSKLLILMQTPFELSLWGYYRDLYPSYFPISQPLPFFNILLVWNNGVSFSMFSNNSFAGRILLIIMGLLISAYVIYLLLQEKDKVNRFGFILIISGAFGNILDRIRYGAVIDFLDFSIGSYHWPAFNLADCFICVGVGLILLQSFVLNKKHKK